MATHATANLTSARSRTPRVARPGRLALAFCFVILALVGARAQPSVPARDKIWTTVGSAGTPDETSAGRVFFERSVVQRGRPIIGQAPGGTAGIAGQTVSAVVRYNVTPEEALFTLAPQPCTGGCGAFKLTLRYLAAGRNSRVVANLIEVDLATGSESAPLLTFDSLRHPRANRYQRQDGAFACGPPFRFDFRNKGYYVEATLTTDALLGGSAAGIQMLKIATDVCP